MAWLVNVLNLPMDNYSNNKFVQLKYYFLKKLSVFSQMLKWVQFTRIALKAFTWTKSACECTYISVTLSMINI